MSRRKAKKVLKRAAAEILLIANELALRPREDCVPVREAREIAKRLRDVAADVAMLAFEVEGGELKELRE